MHICKKAPNRKKKLSLSVDCELNVQSQSLRKLNWNVVGYRNIFYSKQSFQFNTYTQTLLIANY